VGAAGFCVAWLRPRSERKALDASLSGAEKTPADTTIVGQPHHRNYDVSRIQGDVTHIQVLIAGLRPTRRPAADTAHKPKAAMTTPTMATPPEAISQADGSPRGR
jgi:hypothetical protein